MDADVGADVGVRWLAQGGCYKDLGTNRRLAVLVVEEVLDQR